MIVDISSMNGIVHLSVKSTVNERKTVIQNYYCITYRFNSYKPDLIILEVAFNYLWWLELKKALMLREQKMN